MRGLHLTQAVKRCYITIDKSVQHSPKFCRNQNHVKNPKEFPFKNIGKKSDEKIKR